MFSRFIKNLKFNAPMEKEQIIQFETMLDHLSGEEIGIALEKLNESAEVLDAILLNGIGKKNRPCGLLQVLCKPQFEEKVVELIFRHTHTLGIRRMNVERYVLPRWPVEIEINGKQARSKQYALDGINYTRPEADALRDLADREGKGVPAFRFDKNNFS